MAKTRCVRAREEQTGHVDLMISGDRFYFLRFLLSLKPQTYSNRHSRVQDASVPLFVVVMARRRVVIRVCTCASRHTSHTYDKLHIYRRIACASRHLCVCELGCDMET
jgi:hypothetical protein